MRKVGYQNLFSFAEINISICLVLQRNIFDKVKSHSQNVTCGGVDRVRDPLGKRTPLHTAALVCGWIQCLTKLKIFNILERLPLLLFFSGSNCYYDLEIDSTAFPI